MGQVIRAGTRFVGEIPPGAECIPFGNDVVVCPKDAPPFVLLEQPDGKYFRRNFDSAHLERSDA